MLGKTLESPLDYKEIKLVHPKGHQSWIFTETTDAGAENPIFQPADMKGAVNWESLGNSDLQCHWLDSDVALFIAVDNGINQSIPKEINPEYSLKGLMLKLKLQYFGHLMQRTDLLEKTLMLGKKVGGKWDDRGWDGWMALPPRWIRVWASSGSWWWTGRPGVLQSTWSQSQTRLSNWTELN